MPTMINPRSMALKNANPRLLTSGNADVYLGASAPLFHVNTSGVPNTSVISFNAVALSMDNTVTYSFSIVGGTLSGVAGNVASLNYSDMTADTATITVTVTWRGTTFTRSTKVTKLRDVDAADVDVDISPENLKQILEGQLTESQLYADLRNRINLVDGPNTLAGSVSAKVKAETDARVAALTQEATNRTTYVQDYAFSKAEVDQSLSIQANTITSAYTAYTDAAKSSAISAASADVRNYSYSKSSTDSAIAATANTLRSEFATNNGASVAWVQDYTYSKATVDSSIASTANTLRSEFAANNGVSVAYLENYAYSKAGTDSAISSATSSLSTTVGQHTTTLQTQATSLNGLSAQYTVKIDNNGYVTGYGLASAIVNGTPTSSFIINADRFAVVAPGVAPKVMFAVGNVNGQSTIGINGNVIIDGTFIFRKTDGTPILTLGGLQPGFEAPGTKNTDQPLSGNLIPANSLPSGVSGYQAGSALAANTWEGPIFGTGPSGNGNAIFSPRNLGTIYTHAFGTPATGSTIDLYLNANERFDVVEGRRYEFGVALSTPRCTGRLVAVWYNAAGTYLTETGGNLVNVGHTYATPAPGAFPRSAIIVEAPTGAAQVMLLARQIHNGGNDPYMFASEWRYGLAGATQSVPSPYTESPAGLAFARQTASAAKATADAAKSAADSANSAMSGFTSALNAKLNATGDQILTGPIALQDAGAIVIGTTDNGTVMSATGFATRFQGVTKFTLPIAGNPTFGGELTAPSGTLGKLKVVDTIYGGDYTGFGWPSNTAHKGFAFSSIGALFGNFNAGKWVQIFDNGNMTAPGFQLVDGQLTLTNTILISPNIPKMTGSFVSSPANSYYFTGNRNDTNRFAGAYEMNVDGANGTETYSFVASTDNTQATARVGGVNGKRMALYVAANGYIGEVQFNIVCTVNQGGISSVFGVSTIVDFQ